MWKERTRDLNMRECTVTDSNVVLFIYTYNTVRLSVVYLSLYSRFTERYGWGVNSTSLIRYRLIFLLWDQLRHSWWWALLEKPPVVQPPEGSLPCSRQHTRRIQYICSCSSFKIHLILRHDDWRGHPLLSDDSINTHPRHINTQH
jgi:hypothetical protein